MYRFGRYSKRTFGAGERGSPGALLNWKEEPVTRQKWGECPADRRSAQAVVTSLSAGSAWPTSCPCRRPHTLLAHLLR